MQQRSTNLRVLNNDNIKILIVQEANFDATSYMGILLRKISANLTQKSPNFVLTRGCHANLYSQKCMNSALMEVIAFHTFMCPSYVIFLSDTNCWTRS